MYSNYYLDFELSNSYKPYKNSNKIADTTDTDTSTKPSPMPILIPII